MRIKFVSCGSHYLQSELFRIANGAASNLQLCCLFKKGSVPNSFLYFPVDEIPFFHWSSKCNFSKVLTFFELATNPSSFFTISCYTIWDDLAVARPWFIRNIPSFDSIGAVIYYERPIGKCALVAFALAGRHLGEVWWLIIF